MAFSDEMNRLIDHVIENGIKRGIEVTLANQCGRSALILIYAGIDAMATLNMPESQVEVKPDDFKAWIDKYIRSSGFKQVSADEFYGSRCGLLHQFGVESRLSRAQQCRIIAYAGASVPQGTISCVPKIIVVPVLALKDAFFNGINQCLKDLSEDGTKAMIVEKRLKEFIVDMSR